MASKSVVSFIYGTYIRRSGKPAQSAGTSLMPQGFSNQNLLHAAAHFAINLYSHAFQQPLKHIPLFFIVFIFRF
jgi:hypothetical protein